MKVKLVIILAIGISACSTHSFAHTSRLAAVKPQAQNDSVTSATSQIAETAPGDSGPPRDNDTVIVAPPFSSLQLNPLELNPGELDPWSAEYLGLTFEQIRAIQRLMSQERREVEPLKTKLQSTHAKLLAAAADQGQSKDVESLAGTEGKILSQLILMSARTEARLRSLLTRAQQKKLDDLNRSRQP